MPSAPQLRGQWAQVGGTGMQGPMLAAGWGGCHGMDGDTCHPFQQLPAREAELEAQ